MKNPWILTAALTAALTLTACGGGGGGGSASPGGGSPPPPPPPPSGQANITLSEATTFQTIDGWEGTIALDWAPGYASKITEGIQRAVDELGMDRVRLEIQASAENTTSVWAQYESGAIPYEQYRCRRYTVVNDDSNPNTINPAGFHWERLDDQIDLIIVPMRNYLASKGRALWVNLAYVAFTSQINPAICSGSYQVHTTPGEYAEYVLATYQHMQSKYGFAPDSWQVMLEPDAVTQWANGQLIGQTIVASAARLQAAGFTPRFVAPSVTNMANALPYLNAINTVSGATNLIYEVSYHRYQDRSVSTLQALADRARQLGRKTAMLEWWVTQEYHNDLHDDLTVGNDSSWQGKSLMTLFKDPSTTGGVLVVQDNVRYTMQYFRAVRRDAVRFQATSTVAEFQPIAFRNPDGSRTVVIKATGGGSVVVGGLPAGSYSVSWAVGSGSSRLSSPIAVTAGSTLSTTMPGAGVMTISSLAGS
jgi:hypothetical protein